MAPAGTRARSASTPARVSRAAAPEAAACATTSAGSMAALPPTSCAADPTVTASARRTAPIDAGQARRPTRSPRAAPIVGSSPADPASAPGRTDADAAHRQRDPHAALSAHGDGGRLPVEGLPQRHAACDEVVDGRSCRRASRATDRRGSWRADLQSPRRLAWSPRAPRPGRCTVPATAGHSAVHPETVRSEVPLNDEPAAVASEPRTWRKGGATAWALLPQRNATRSARVSARTGAPPGRGQRAQP